MKPKKAKPHPWVVPLALACVVKGYRQVEPVPGKREWVYPQWPGPDYRLSLSGTNGHVGGCSCKAGTAGKPCYHAASVAVALLVGDYQVQGLDYDIAFLVHEHGEEAAARILLPQLMTYLPRYGHPREETAA